MCLLITSRRNPEFTLGFFSSSSNANIFLSCLQPSVSKEPQEPQTVTETFFRTPGGPNTVSSLSAPSDGTGRISPGTLYIPQRKLEVSED